MTFTRLTWGVKASFRAYVEAAEGVISPNACGLREAEASTRVARAVPFLWHSRLFC